MRGIIRKYQKPIKYLMVGGSGSLIQLSLLKFFTDGLHIYYMVSGALAILVAVTWTFGWNNFWTFKQKGIL